MKEKPSMSGLAGRGILVVVIGSLALATQNVLLRVIFSESDILGQFFVGRVDSAIASQFFAGLADEIAAHGSRHGARVLLVVSRHHQRSDPTHPTPKAVYLMAVPAQRRLFVFWPWCCLFIAIAPASPPG